MAETAQHRSAWKVLVASSTVLAAALSLQGCLFRKKKQPRVFVPPPVVARSAPQPQPIVLPPLPEVTVEAGPGDVVVAPRLASLPPAPAKPASAKPAKPAPPQPVVVETAPPAAPPKAVAIFTAEELRQMNQELDERLGNVRRALARTEGKTLSPELAMIANSARSFMLQAEQARSLDLVTAVNLAKRADLFAMDLVQRLP